MLLVDTYRNRPEGHIVASSTEAYGKTKFEVCDSTGVFQQFLGANEKTLEGFAREIEMEGSRHYRWISRADYDNPQEATQRLMNKILGRTE